MEAMGVSRIGSESLKVDRNAPGFTLACILDASSRIANGQARMLALHLVLTQPGRGLCAEILLHEQCGNGRTSLPHFMKELNGDACKLAVPSN
jgi:hypothetical protein